MAKTKITKRSADQLARDAIEAGKTLLIWDTDLSGFGARATAKGTLSYFVEYRLGGRQGRCRRMTFARHGVLTPDQARRKALTLKADLAQGIDVADVKQEHQRRLRADTFAEAAERYLALNGQHNRSWKETRRLITYDALPDLGKRRIDMIQRSDVAALIDCVAQRSPSVARALFAALRPMFKWCLQRGIIQQNPCDGLEAPKPSPSRDRVLDNSEVRALWHGTEQLGFPFGPLFRLLLLTGQRREEVAALRWTELDLETAIWMLPSARTKNAKLHLVDLSAQACDLLKPLPRTSEFVFSTNGRTAPSGFSRAKMRLDALLAQDLGGPVPSWRAHDLRRTAATGMAELGFPPQVVEHVLNHVSGVKGGLVGVYQRHEYRQERNQALQAWGARVEQVCKDMDESANVVAFRPRQIFGESTDG